jgi:hypothetical protein
MRTTDRWIGVNQPEEASRLVPNDQSVLRRAAYVVDRGHKGG